MNEENIKREEQSILPPFGIIGILYGLLFCFCLYKNTYSYTSLVICGGTIAYFLYCFKKLEIGSFKYRSFFILCICLLGLSNMLTASKVLIFMNYIGILLLLFYFLVNHFYETRRWDFGKYTGSLLQTMCCSIGKIHYPFKNLWNFCRKNGKLKNSKIGYVALGLLISVPLLLVVGSLLLSADVVFRDFTGNFLEELLADVNFGTIFGITFTFFLGLTFSYGILAELYEKKISPDIKEKKTMEPIIAVTFTSVLGLVYVAFCLIQIFYLFLGQMELPKGYTYAMYAREGFFQLLFVCLINLVLVLFCLSHFRDNKVLKVLLTVICACTYIMIASSIMRMLLYVESYHLTFLRVLVLVADFALALCLLGVILAIYKPDFPLFTYMTVIVTLCYLGFSLSRPDTYIAAYNIEKESADGEYLYNLSPDAAPILEKAGYLEISSDSQLMWSSLDYSKNYYTDRCEKEYEKQNFRRFNLSVYLAGKALE